MDEGATPSRSNKPFRKASLGVLDQGISSLTNVAVSVVIARSTNIQTFGAFSLVFATYVICLGIGRALASESLLVGAVSRTDSSRRKDARSASGAALLVGVGGLLSLWLSSWFIPEPQGESFRALAFWLPGLLIQDAYRVSFFATGRPGLAAANDLVWGMAQLGLIYLVLVTGPRPYSVPRLITAWGIAGTLAATIGAWQTRSLPSPAAGWTWLRGNRQLALSYLGEFFLITGTAQALLFVLAASGGLSSVAQFRGAQVLLGPLTALFAVALLWGVPEASQRLATNRSSVNRTCLTVAATLCLASAAWTAILLLVPVNIGTQVLGAAWVGAHRLLLLLGLSYAAASIGTGAFIGLRALRAGGRTMRVRASVGGLTLVIGSVGALTLGSVGAATGLMVANIVGSFLWWSSYKDAFRSRRGSDIGEEDTEDLHVEKEVLRNWQR